MAVQSNRIFLPGNRYLIWYLTFLSAFAPLSTDMYLPALPIMAQMLHTTDELVTYSMTSFFFIYALSTLFWGPLSDRYGRKPILFWGSGIYFCACAVIALTNSIWVLLVMRGFQAIGCASASAVSLAIIKDILRGAFMEKIVSLMQAAHILAPMCAPVIGGAMLYFMSWRGIFWGQALCGALAFAGALCLKETARTTGAISLSQAFRRMTKVLGNVNFIKPLLLFSLLCMPFMAYLAVSAFAFQNYFGLSAQAFSLFFALNASFSLLAPLAHMFWFYRWPRGAVIAWEILLMFISGCLLLLAGCESPWIFALLMAVITFCGSAMRPPSTVIMMEANRGDNGIVAALIQCAALLFASFAMFVAPLSFWPNPVIAIGAIAVIIPGICVVGWLKIRTQV